MPRLILTTSTPWLAGLRGVLTVEPATLETVAALVSSAARERRLVSLISFQETCDVLAALAGLSGVHRYNKNRDDPREADLRDGDNVLICIRRPSAKQKPDHELGAIDFTYTLCTWAAHTTEK